MILKVNSNPNFTLTLKLDIDYEIEAINILVILQNIKTAKKKCTVTTPAILKKRWRDTVNTKNLYFKTFYQRRVRRSFFIPLL